MITDQQFHRMETNSHQNHTENLLMPNLEKVKDNDIHFLFWKYFEKFKCVDF